MADRKRENEHEIIIAHACHISKVLAGQFKPEESNPYKKKNLPRREMTDKEFRDAQQTGLGALKQALIGMYGAKLKKKKF